MRGAGVIGYPGAAEVVNMHAPARLIAQGVHQLPCIGDGRQSGTSGSPSILHVCPEAATGGALAIVRTGDRVRVDLPRGEVRLLVGEAEVDARRRALAAAGGYSYPRSQTPWQELQGTVVGPLATGAALEPALKYQRIAQSKSILRHNH